MNQDDNGVLVFGPLTVLMAMDDRGFHTIPLQMLVAMPYPFWRTPLRRITIMLALTS